jgi:hypothetical protein
MKREVRSEAAYVYLIRSETLFPRNSGTTVAATWRRIFSGVGCGWYQLQCYQDSGTCGFRRLDPLMCRAMRVTGDRIGGSGGLEGYRCCRFVIYLSLGLGVAIDLSPIVILVWLSLPSLYLGSAISKMLFSCHCGDICMFGCSDCTESTIASMTDMSLGLR